MKNGLKIGKLIPTLNNIGGILGNQTVNPKLKDGWLYAGFTPAHELYESRFWTYLNLSIIFVFNIYSIILNNHYNNKA